MNKCWFVNFLKSSSWLCDLTWGDTAAGLCGALSRSPLKQHLCGELKMLLLSALQQVSNISITDHLAEAEFPWQTSRRRRREIKSKPQGTEVPISSGAKSLGIFTSCFTLLFLVPVVCTSCQIQAEGSWWEEYRLQAQVSLGAEHLGQTGGAGPGFIRALGGIKSAHSCAFYVQLLFIAMPSSWSWEAFSLFKK